MMKPALGVLVLALVVGAVAFAAGKATVSDAKSTSQHLQSTDTANPTKAPALASTSAIPALRKPKPAAPSSTGSTSSPSTPAAPSGPTTPAPGPSGGGGGGTGGTNNETPGAGEF
jgi:hypothetical protein